jgi:hypothetical protein
LDVSHRITSGETQHMNYGLRQMSLFSAD